MSYEIPLELPEGLPGATPQLALRYNSLSGNGALGVGWDLWVPHIERFTLRGVPRYDEEDIFAANGDSELVRLRTSTKRTQTVHRERFESSFVRYVWHRARSENDDYWEAQYPDGGRGFFGADAHGRPVPTARVVDPETGEVFRYMLAETQDALGHRVRYHYTSDDRYALLSEVEYLFDDDRPRYVIHFGYQPRRDPVSSALSGFDLRLSKRLTEVEIRTRETTLRRYELTYEEARAGISRLKQVTKYGLGAARFPAVATFAYSSSLHLACDNCARPFVYSMGQLAASESGGVGLENGRTTLIDINGDALPDVLQSDGEFGHRFFYNEMTDDGSQRFSEPTPSKISTGAFLLTSPGVQVADLNGDGLADIFSKSTRQILCNRGTGDWATRGCGELGLEQLDLVNDGDADPQGIRFLDADGDKRIDILRTSENRTSLWLRTADSFEEHAATHVGRMFDGGSHLQLADLNGDGLLDPIEVQERQVWYRLSLGRGRFGPEQTQTLAWEKPEQAASVENGLWELEDLNGDGLDDVVAVIGDRIHFGLNQSGTFQRLQVLTSNQVQGELPVRDGNTSVLFADMNGSGSTDVVWVDANGQVKVLEMFALRPNLLTEINNGLGGIQRVEYGTSARERARDAQAGIPWRHRLPQAINVVTATEVFSALSPDVVDRTERRYHHGFYDGEEKRYRGFARIEEDTQADAAQEASHTVLEYDVGSGDPYYQGKLVRAQLFAKRATQGHSQLTPIRRVRHFHADCPLDDVPRRGLRTQVRYVCEVATETQLQEDQPEADWVTLRSEFERDGFGNVTLNAQLGVIGRGRDGQDACGVCTAPEGTSSGPCGADCLGDEHFVETEYVAPASSLQQNAWIVGKPWRTRGYGQPGGPYTEAIYFYDGEPFVGLPAGQLSAGLLTRACQRMTPNAAPRCRGPGWLQQVRVARDAHGNVKTELDPLGAPDDTHGHRRTLEYDRYGLRITALEVFLASDGRPYRLRRELEYDQRFYQLSSMTRWMLQDAPVRSKRGETRIAYDAFGRRSKIVRAGDTLAAPSQEFTYELNPPISQIVVRGRSERNGPLDMKRIQCVDGLGRTLQQRTRVSQGVYQVTGFVETSPRGLPRRTYQNYLGGGYCEGTPPSHVAFREHFHDAAGRSLRLTEPDAALYGTASTHTTEYGPLSVSLFDAEDNDPESPHHKTPHIRLTDGLGRAIRLERTLDSRGVVGSVTALWDTLGRFAGYIDAEGHRHSQKYDLLGRPTSIETPNSGVTRFAHDAAGNLVRVTDARGVTVQTEFDGANRPTVRYNPARRRATQSSLRYDFAPSCRSCTNAEGRVASSHYPLSTQGKGSDEHAYDLRGRELSMTRMLYGKRFTLARVYDNADRVVGRFFPDGTAFRYRFDDASRPVAIEGIVDKVEFDDRGSLAKLAYSNGTVLIENRDVLQRLRASRTLDPRGALLQGFRYTRDRAGNPLAIEDLTDPRYAPTRADVRFDYDAWYRLQHASFEDDSEELDLSFDILDNISHKISNLDTESAAHAGVYAYAPSRPNAVLSTEGLSFNWDASGRAIRRADTSLHWDFQGRLASASSADGHRAAYEYSFGVDRVLERHDGHSTMYVGPDFEIRDGIAVTYARLGRKRVARSSSSALGSKVFRDYNDDGRVDVGDAWLAPRREDSGSPALHAAARRVLLEQGHPKVFLHADHLHSLTLATGPSGVVLGSRTYYPFGTPRRSTGYVDEYGFTGQRRDATTNLLHMRFRELDPVSGRWNSPDPWFTVMDEDKLQAQGEATTGYAYVAGRPTQWVDPSGLFSVKTLARRLSVGGLLAGAGHHARTQALSISPRRASGWPKGAPGTATVYQHGAHFSVEVVDLQGQRLATHLTPDPDHGLALTAPSTQVTTTSEKFVKPTQVTRTFGLPDPEAAMAVQRQELKQREHGPYNLGNNNCIGHVCRVLSAGGIDVPRAGVGQIILMNGLTGLGDP